jgi:hypothetical protein
VLTTGDVTISPFLYGLCLHENLRSVSLLLRILSLGCSARGGAGPGEESVWIQSFESRFSCVAVYTNQNKKNSFRIIYLFIFMTVASLYTSCTHFRTDILFFLKKKKKKKTLSITLYKKYQRWNFFNKVMLKDKASFVK